jgi:hypothetical protein
MSVLAIAAATEDHLVEKESLFQAVLGSALFETVAQTFQVPQSRTGSRSWDD